MLKELAPLLKENESVSLILTALPDSQFSLNILPRLGRTKDDDDDDDDDNPRNALLQPLTLGGTLDEITSPEAFAAVTKFKDGVTGLRTTLDEAEAATASAKAKTKPASKPATTPAKPAIKPVIKPAAKAAPVKTPPRPVPGKPGVKATTPPVAAAAAPVTTPADAPEPAFGGNEHGRLADFPDRGEAEAYRAIQQGRPGFADYETSIEKQAEDRYDLVYTKRSALAEPAPAPAPTPTPAPAAPKGALGATKSFF